MIDLVIKSFHSVWIGIKLDVVVELVLTYKTMLVALIRKETVKNCTYIFLSTKSRDFGECDPSGAIQVA